MPTPDFWYDQPQNEWVIVLKGAARLQFEDGMVEMKVGDFINIPAFKKHRVDWTTPDEPTVWLGSSVTEVRTNATWTPSGRESFRCPGPVEADCPRRNRLGLADAQFGPSTMGTCFDWAAIILGGSLGLFVSLVAGVSIPDTMLTIGAITGLFEGIVRGFSYYGLVGAIVGGPLGLVAGMIASVPVMVLILMILCLGTGSVKKAKSE